MVISNENLKKTIILPFKQNDIISLKNYQVKEEIYQTLSRGERIKNILFATLSLGSLLLLKNIREGALYGRKIIVQTSTLDFSKADDVAKVHQIFLGQKKFSNDTGLDSTLTAEVTCIENTLLEAYDLLEVGKEVDQPKLDQALQRLKELKFKVGVGTPSLEKCKALIDGNKPVILDLPVLKSLNDEINFINHGPLDSIKSYILSNYFNSSKEELTVLLRNLEKRVSHINTSKEDYQNWVRWKNIHFAAIDSNPNKIY